MFRNEYEYEIMLCRGNTGIARKSYLTCLELSFRKRNVLSNAKNELKNDVFIIFKTNAVICKNVIECED